MDKLESYQNIIEQILNEYAAIPFAYGEIDSEAVFDRTKDRYLLMTVGWENERRVHSCLVHVDIVDGKFWIQRDGTEDGIATELERAGVSKSDIVLAFHEPELRKFTEYAVV
ncbi:MAG: XisI protein [Acidobacteria bacterium]|nr:XisI protein [Acidobacteriota bacterium]MBA4122843.1 XisI protein [Acidobacteriota bacterium]